MSKDQGRDEPREKAKRHAQAVQEGAKLMFGRRTPAMMSVEAENARVYHSSLSAMLDRERSTVLAQSGKYMAITPDLLSTIADQLTRARIVVWLQEPYDRTVSRRTEYRDVMADRDTVPINPDLWIVAGNVVHTEVLASELYGVTSRLLLSFPDQYLVCLFRILHPMLVDGVDLSATPTVLLSCMIRAEDVVGRNQGEELYACLRHLNQPTVSDGMRVISDRTERGGAGVTAEDQSSRLVKLPRKKAGDGLLQRTSERTCTVQHEVVGHYRRPSPKQKVPYPVWVPCHTRGPTDKPLKEVPQTVYMVTR